MLMIVNGETNIGNVIIIIPVIRVFGGGAVLGVHVPLEKYVVGNGYAIHVEHGLIFVLQCQKLIKMMVVLQKRGVII